MHAGVTYDNPIPGYMFLIGWVGVFALGAALGMERSIVARIFGAILIIVAAVPAVTIRYFVVMRRQRRLFSVVCLSKRLVFCRYTQGCWLAPSFSHCLRLAEAELAQRGLTFGSRNHIASFEPLPRPRPHAAPWLQSKSYALQREAKASRRFMFCLR